MRKSKYKKNKEHIVRFESNNISRELMIEIQAEAYYRALNRIENERIEANKKVTEKKKSKWYENVFFVLCVFYWPWIINKRFRVSNNILDS